MPPQLGEYFNLEAERNLKMKEKVHSCMQGIERGYPCIHVFNMVPGLQEQLMN